MKYAIERPRPSMHFDGYSFPSMHVLSVCLVVSLVILVTHSSWAKIIADITPIRINTPIVIVTHLS